MGKAEVGTPKYLANKMKAKGLQKLRWYCQMCEKQCRDENGFKCHTMSETHQRQLLLFADSPGKFLYSFSKEFTDGYMELLRRRFGTKRTNANKVYQEYISAKDHVHMNATRWLTLSDFVKWLGRTGQVVADETEKGWYVSYIDRSPEAMERQAKSERKEKMEKDDEERMRDFIEKQIESAAPATSTAKTDSNDAIEFKREDNQPLRLDIRLERKYKPESRPMPRSPFEGTSKKIKTEEHEVTSTTGSSGNKSRSIDENLFKRPHPVIKSEMASTSRGGALGEIIEMEERKKDLNNRKDYWLHPGIVVKFMSKSLGGNYYKQKAVVLETIGKYSAKIQFIHSGEKMKADQTHLETIIPSLDKSVMVVNGGYRGWEAILRKVNEHKGTATIEIVRGPYKGRLVSGIIFDDISKLN